MNLSGKLISNQYKIIEKIKDGSMSEVWLARDSKKNKQLALKILKKESISNKTEDIIRFRKEATTISTLNHINIVKTREIGEFGDLNYIVMELVKGKSLFDFIEEGITFNQNQVVEIIIGICNALKYVHNLGIIHRDLKPGNIMIVPVKIDPITVDPGKGYKEGCPLLPKLLDFGLAELKEYTAIKEQEITGTFSYMSPEQSGIMKKPVDERSDLYSLGVIFYQLLTGELPFKGKDIITILHQQVARIPDPPGELREGIPVILENIVLKLLNKEQEERYQSAHGLMHDLKKFQQGEVDFIPGKKDTFIKLPFRTRLIGREKEVSHLKDIYNSASEGKGEICLLSGEAGRGKTRLVEELTGYVFKKGGVFLSGKCFAQKNKIPYQPFREVLEKYINKIHTIKDGNKEKIISRIKEGTGELGEILIKLSPSMKEIIGEVPSLVPLEPDRENKRFLMVCSRFFRNLGMKGSPVVLLLDDLQWADEGSLLLLHEISQGIGESPLLILGTYRENEVSREHGLITLIKEAKERELPVEEINITIFDFTHMNRFVSELLFEEESSTKKISRYILKKSGGNPFFALEIVKQLVDEKVVTYQERHWEIDWKKLQGTEISPTILDIVLRRIGLLREEDVHLLSYAAVIGKQFELRLLFELSELENEQIVSIVDRAIGLQLLEKSLIEKGKILFVHDRIKEAFYRKIGKERRKELHLEIAKVMEEMDSEKIDEIVFDLAHHYTEGGDHDKSIIYAFPAAKKAKESYANDQAVRYFIITNNILEEKGKIGSEQWIETNEDIGEIFLTIGKSDDAIDIYNTLLPFIETKIGKAKIYRQISTAYFKKGDWGNCEEQGRIGLRLLGEKLPVKKAQVVLRILKEFIVHILHNLLPVLFTHKGKKVEEKYRLIIWLYYTLNWMYIVSDITKFLRSVLRMLNIAESRLDRSKELGLTIGVYASLCMVKALFKRSHSYQKKALNLREELGDEWGVAQCLQWLGFCYTWRGEYKQAIQCFTDSLNKFQKIGDMWEMGMVLNGLYQCYFYLPDYNKAKEILDWRLNIAKKMNDDYSICACLQYFSCIYMEMGEIDRAGDYVKKALVLNKKRKILLESCKAYIRFGILHLEKGNSKYALKYLNKAKRLNENNRFLKDYTVLLYTHLAEAFLLQFIEEKNMPKKEKKYRLKKIKKSCKDALHITKSWVTHYGGALRVQGKYYALINKKKKAKKFFLKSIELCKRIGRRYECAKSYYEYGHWLNSISESEQAKKYWQEAYSVFKEIGSQVYMKRTADLLDLDQENETSQERLLDKRRLSSISDVSQQISSILHLGELLKNIIDKAIEVTGAQRGYLLIANDKTEELEIRSTSNLDHDEITSKEFQFSRSIINDVYQTGRRIITTNARENVDFSMFPSVVSYNLKSILCVPIKYREKITGVCYLDNPLSSGVFSKEDGDILNIFISQVAICIENARAYNEIDMLNKSLEKKVEERTRELNKAKEEADRANQAKTNFLAKMSHEIRNPLCSIMGFSDVIKDSKYVNEHGKYADFIMHESEKLLDIINTLLDISKIEAGKFELINKNFYIDDVIKSVNSSMGMMAEKKGLEFTIHLDKNVPDYLTGDFMRLCQVLTNLVRNAIKFTKKGEVRITIDQKSVNDKAVTLLFKVIDTGMGIPRDKQKTIFESYAQADMSITEKFGGTGLGLAISKQLVTLMGGEIGLSSKEGKGSTFWFTARFVKSLVAPGREIHKSKEPDTRLLKNKSILIVEDSMTIRVFIERWLIDTGSTIIFAVNGREALEKFSAGNIDLILMDIQIPEIDGYTVTMKIRDTEKGSKIPIIGITGNIMKTAREKCFSSGMNDILAKPFVKNEFMEKIIHWIAPGQKIEYVDEAKSGNGDLPDENTALSPINFEEALFEHDGDKEGLLDLIGRFLIEVKSQVKEMNKAVKENNIDIIRKWAHKINGGASLLTANNLSAAARKLENMKKPVKTENVVLLMDKLKEEVNNLEEWYNQEIS